MSEEQEATLWEHIEELAIRLRRIVIAVVIGVVVAFLFPVQAIELIVHVLQILLSPLVTVIAHYLPHFTLFAPPSTTPHTTGGGANTTSYVFELISRGMLACTVRNATLASPNATILLTCRLIGNHTLHNSTHSGAHSFLDIPLPYEYWTPLVVKIPQLIVALVIPREVYIAGKTYRIVLMPADAFEVFKITLTTAIFIGLVLASPVIVKEIWGYVEPALYPHEKRAIKRYAAAFFGLFIFGVLFALFVIAPLIYRITLSLYPFFVPNGYSMLIRVSVAEVVEFTLELAAATGLLFEIPLILYILLVHEIISIETIERNMKYVFLASMILGAIISPDPSGIGMLVIGFTVYLPIHIAVKLAKKKLEKKREARSEG